MKNKMENKEYLELLGICNKFDRFGILGSFIEQHSKKEKEVAFDIFKEMTDQCIEDDEKRKGGITMTKNEKLMTELSSLDSSDAITRMADISDSIRYESNPYDTMDNTLLTKEYPPLVATEPEEIPYDNYKINEIAIKLGRKELFNNIKDTYQIGKMKKSDKAYSYPEFCEIALSTDKIPRNVSYNELLDYFKFELYEEYNKTGIR